MTAYELIANLSKIAKTNPDSEVEIHVKKRWITEKLDWKKGEGEILESETDTYTKEFTVEHSNLSGHDKVCISASIN